MPHIRTNRGISEWMRIFQDIYGKPDSDRSPEQIWIAMMAHCSSIGEDIRRNSFLTLLSHAAHAFCWLCSYVNKCNQIKDSVYSITEDLSEMVSLKYPLVCGHCKEARCHCDAISMDRKNDKAADYMELLNIRKDILASVRMYSFYQWQERFRRIYVEKIHILTLDGIGFHFLEEVGEESLAVRMLSQLKGIADQGPEEVNIAFLNKLTTVQGIVENYRDYYRPKISYSGRDPDMLKWRIVEAKMRMIIEIADAFSWFCSILNKLDSMVKMNNFQLPTLEETLNEHYVDDGNARCPECIDKPCSCTFFS